MMNVSIFIFIPFAIFFFEAEDEGKIAEQDVQLWHNNNLFPSSIILSSYWFRMDYEKYFPPLSLSPSLFSSFYFRIKAALPH